MNIEQNEYVGQLSSEAGVRVFIGVQNEMPFPYEQGMSVSPGFSTAIQLRKVEIFNFSLEFNTHSRNIHCSSSTSPLPLDGFAFVSLEFNFSALWE